MILRMGLQKPGFLRKYFVTTTNLVKNPVSLVEMRPGLKYSSPSYLPLCPLRPLRLKNSTIDNTDKDRPHPQNPSYNLSDKTPDSNH
jgi:hypothetical protein